MSRVPDAWDDDYEAIADRPISTSTFAPQPRVSRAERKAQHQEANKRLWNSAENPQTFHFVDTRDNGVPLNTKFKPALKVLSRKPTKPTALENGTQSPSLNPDEEDIDSEEEERRERERTLKQKQEQATIERAEKQRRYAEVRERLGIGSPEPVSNTVSGRNSPTKSQGGRARGRGGARSCVNGRATQQTSSTEQSPAPPNGQRQLYDPSDSVGPRTGGYRKAELARREPLSKPTREPKGPDGSGRGGFGFTARGKSDP